MCVMYIASQSAFVGKYIDLANVTKVYSSNKKSGNKGFSFMLTNLRILLLTDWEGYMVYCVMACAVVTRLLASLAPLHCTQLQSAECGSCYAHCGMTAAIHLSSKTFRCVGCTFGAPVTVHIPETRGVCAAAYPLTSFPLRPHTSTHQVICSLLQQFCSRKHNNNTYQLHFHLSRILSPFPNNCNWF